MSNSREAQDAPDGRETLSSRGWGGLRSTLAALALLALAALVTYHNSLNGPFIFDDEPSIVRNSDIRQLATTLRENQHVGATLVGRPILRLSLWVNYKLGGLGVRGYHALNLALHLLTACVLWRLLQRILESPRLKDRYAKAAPGLALTISLIWMVHPLQTESVTYVVQRAEILGGLFYLLTLYSVARGACASGEAISTWFFAAGISCLLGIASKETVATAPLLALALDRIFFAPSWRRLWQARKLLYLALYSTWIPLAVLMRASSNRAGSAGFGLGIRWWEYALTQPYYLCRYLALAIWPRALVFDYGTYLAQTMGEVAPYAAIVLLLFGLTLVALWRAPTFGFYGLWFFLILAPTSSVVPMLTQTGAEHRMYLPLVGLIAPIVLGGYVLWQRVGTQLPKALRAGPVLVVGLVVTALGARTVARNEEYRSEVSIWQTVVDRRPINPRAPLSLGNAILRATGRIPEAIAQFEAALRLKPDYAEAHNDLGSALASAGRISEAIAQFEEVVRLEPDYVVARNNLGVALFSAGRIPEAIAQFEEALRLKPDYAEAHDNLGSILASAGRNSEAIAQFEEALRLKPGLGGGRLPAAIAQLKAALLLQQQQRRSGPSSEAGSAP
jgi:protein O-mannosyl-transferase